LEAPNIKQFKYQDALALVILKVDVIANPYLSTCTIWAYLIIRYF